MAGPVDTESRRAERANKALWGDGPWQSEPDRVEWKTDAGLPAIVLRHPTMGHLCGYVAVPSGHPLHGKDYDTPDVDVHGGLTYAEACSGPVCHEPGPGEIDDVWWFGFDAAHCGDCSPGTNALTARYGWCGAGEREGELYKTVEYMKAECERLAQQLGEVSP